MEISDSKMKAILYAMYEGLSAIDYHAVEDKCNICIETREAMRLSIDVIENAMRDNVAKEVV